MCYMSMTIYNIDFFLFITVYIVCIIIYLLILYFIILYFIQMIQSSGCTEIV